MRVSLLSVARLGNGQDQQQHIRMLDRQAVRPEQATRQGQLCVFR